MASLILSIRIRVSATAAGMKASADGGMLTHSSSGSPAGIWSSYLKNQCPQLLPRLSFIKVDAEGYDIRILKTLSSVIAERRPFIKAEVYKHTNPGQREDLYRFFAEHHYVIHRTDNEACLRGEVLGASDLMKWRHFDIFCTPETSPERSRVS